MQDKNETPAIGKIREALEYIERKTRAAHDGIWYDLSGAERHWINDAANRALAAIDGKEASNE